jgi:hypothetical protein
MRTPVILKVLAILIGLTTVTRAQIPVTDFASIIQDQTNWITELAQWTESLGNDASQISNQVEQIVNQYEQITQIDTYLDRFGDPSALAGLIDIESAVENARLTGILESYGETVEGADGDYSLTRTGGGIHRAAPTTLADGTSIERDVEAYRKFAVHDEVRDRYAAKSEDYRTAREGLQQQVETTMTDLDSAPDDATVARLTAKLNGLNAQMEQLYQEQAISAAESTITANDLEVTRRRQEQAAAEAFDQQHEKAMEEATQLTFPKPQPAGPLRY